MFTHLYRKLFLSIVISLSLTACDNALEFSELFKSCTPPQSSARYGKNQGPVITSPEALTPSKGTQEISGTCVDGIPVYIGGNGLNEQGTVDCVGGTFKTTITYSSGDGNKEVDVSQKSSGEEEDAIMDRLCFTKDTLPPNVKISGNSGAQAIGKKTVTIVGICENGLPVDISGPNLDRSQRVDCVGGQFSATVTFTGNDGLKHVVAEQTDRAGNKGDDDKDYLTDTVAPVVRITSPADNSYSTGITTVRGTCESNLDVVLMGSAISNRPVKTACINSSFMIDLQVASPDGPKVLQAQQSDAAGNTGRDQINIIRDATAPSVTITSPSVNYTNSSSVTIAGRCESGLQVRITGSGLRSNLTTSCNNAAYSVGGTLSSGDGLKDMTASQTDAAGNTGSANKDVTLDTTAPVVSINSPDAGKLVKAYVDVSGVCEVGLPVTLSGTGALSQVNTNCGAGTYTARVNLTAGDGQKNVVATQVDLAGNSKSDNRNFVRDESAPMVQITSPANNSASTGELLLTGTCENSLTVQLSGSITAQTVSCSSGKFTATVTLLGPIGSKTVTAEQTDSNGNRGFDTKTYRKVNNMGYLTFSSPGPGGMVDILFVDDNSVSMELEQKRLGERFSSFALELKDYDWQAGVTTTDCSSSNPNYNICGSLLDFTGTNDYILTQKTPNYLDAFQRTIQRPETWNPDTGLSCAVDPNVSCPSPFEEPLRATTEAMNKRNGDNKRFFRDKADLAVVILSDEDESGATKAQDVVTQFKRIWPADKKLSVYGIIVKPGDAACLRTQQSQTVGGNAAYGTQISQFAQLGGGFTASVCETDYTLTLREIGQNVTKLNRTVPLEHTPIKNTVRVVFTPAHNTKWVVETDKIVFDDPAPLGTKVEIFYEY